MQDKQLGLGADLAGDCIVTSSGVIPPLNFDRAASFPPSA
jgi:hypothetical protein